MIVDRLRRRLAELRADGPPAGRDWCRAWSDAVDRAMVGLHAGSVHRDRLTVAAVGGYGRRELCPWSDIDLLILHEDLEEPALEVAVRELVYPLWDAGVQVGYAVRSRREASRVRDLEVDDITAALDARPVAGSTAVVTAVTEALRRTLHRDPGGFVGALARSDDDRHARRGDAAEVLEPDLKSGAGGLRDVQSLRWAAGALVGEPRLDALVSAAYIGATDRIRLAAAYERILAQRVALHLVSGGPGDVLSFERQPEVAARLGYADGAGDHDTASHRLLTDHFLAARVIDHVHRRAWTLMGSDLRRGRRRRRTPDSLVDGFPVADGVLEVAGDLALDDAELPTRILQAVARSGAVLSRGAVQRLRREVDERAAPIPWTPRALDRFVAVLWTGRAGLHATIELDDAGVLGALLPEWEPMRGRAQRNPYHRFSLDRHAIHTAATLGELVRHEEWAATTLEEVEDREALMLGALLHDIGKAYGEPHTETGRPAARALLDRLGVGPSTRSLVDRMIRLHLLLPGTATRRDLSDPEVIRGVAAEVGGRETLACLHLLAAADGIATGPTAWSRWTAALVEQLVTSVRAELHPTGRDHLADLAVATARRAQALATERGVDPELVRGHLAMLSSRYAAATTPDAVVRQAELAVPATAGRLTAVAEPTEVGTRLLVAAPDQPGLLAVVAGTVTVRGGSVLEAQADTRSDGVAVQSFVVRAPDHAEAGWAEALSEAIRQRHADPEQLARDLARRRDHAGRRPAALTAEVGTEITVEHTSRATVVEVRTADRPGLLHLGASTLTELGYGIHGVKAVVEGPRAIDTFVVSRLDGTAVDADAESELELALLTSIGTGLAAPAPWSS